MSLKNKDTLLHYFLKTRSLKIPLNDIKFYSKILNYLFTLIFYKNLNNIY